MNRHHRRWSGLAVLVLLMAWCLLVAAPAPGQEKKEFDVKSLPKVLKDGADSLEKDIPAGKADTEALQQLVKQAEKDLQDLGNQIATLKASQAAGELQVKQAQEALDGFSQRQGQVAAQIKDLQDKREQLSKQASARVAAFEGLKQEAERLKAVKNSLWKSPEIQKAWERYQQLAKQYRAAATQTLDRYDAVLEGPGRGRPGPERRGGGAEKLRGGEPQGGVAEAPERRHAVGHGEADLQVSHGDAGKAGQDPGRPPPVA